MTSDQLTASILHAIERYSSHKSQPPKQSNHIRLHGLSICIETPKGHRRRPDWPEMPADYGYIKRTEGADGDAVDVFIGPHQNSEMVYVIDQCCKDGTFDEHKVMLGYTNYKKAVDAYKNAYSKGWKVGKVTSMTIEQFKAWLKQGDKGSQIQHQVSRYAYDMFDDSGKPRLRPSTLRGTGSYAPVPQTWALNTDSPHVMSHQSQMPQDGTKQPWHMSIEEFAQHHAKNPGMINGGLSRDDGALAGEFIRKNFGPETYRVLKFSDEPRKQHIYNIAHAMRTGQPVHPNAIADYPRDIVPQQPNSQLQREAQQGNVMANPSGKGMQYSASSGIPPTASDQTRLTHFFANPDLKKKFLSGEPFQYHKQGLIDLTTDSFSNNNDVHSLLQTGKAGAFDRGSFGPHVLIMDVPHADHRMHNNLQFASGEVHNGHIVGVYDRESGQFHRNPAYGTAPQYKPGLQQQVSQHRPSSGQQPQTHSTPVPHPSEHRPVRPDDIWSAIESSVVDRYSEQHFNTPEFKQWFGNSHARNEDGGPKPLYHGGNSPIDEFKTTGGHGLRYGSGAYFTDDPEKAAYYATRKTQDGASIGKHYLSMQNPYVDHVKTEVPKELIEHLHKSLPDSWMGDEGRKILNNWHETKEWASAGLLSHLFDNARTGIDGDKIQNALKSLGHDGVIGRREGKDTEYIAFHPHQIKSATGNSGAYSPHDKRINYSAISDRYAGFQQPGLFDDIPPGRGFDEKKHPRWKGGDQAHHGGQFSPKQGGESKAHQPNLFETHGHQDQGWLFADEGVHGGMVLTPHDPEPVQQPAPAPISAPAQQPQSQGLIQPPKEIPNEQAKPGQQLGLFGDAPVQKVRPPKLDIGNDPKAKQRNLFDTGGNSNQMDLFGDGVIPDDLVHKPQNPGMGVPQKPKGLAGFMRGESQPLPKLQDFKPMEDSPDNEPTGQQEEPKPAINPMARPEDPDHADHHLSLADMPKKNEPVGHSDRFNTEINDPRTRNYLLSAAKQMTRDPHEAEDIVQDTMTKAFMSKHKYDPSQPFLGWIRTILERTKINNYRDKKALKRGGGKAIGSLDAPLDNDNGGSLHDQIGGDQRKKGSDIHPDEREAFNAALPSLPPNQRKIVEMHLEGHLKKEIADHLKVSGAAVGQALERALIALKKKISKNYVLDALIDRYCQERDAEYYSMCFRVYRYSVFGEIDRYDNTEEVQPQAQPAKPQGGMFSGRMNNGTEIADRPASISQDHSLHLKQVANNPATHETAKKLASSGLSLRSMWSDAKEKHEASKSSGTPSSSPYDHVDWGAVKGHLDEVNQLHKDGLAKGHNVANIANYNGIIPKWLHPKLASGRKFIDPSMLGAKWTKDTPQAPQAPKAPDAPGDSEHGFQTGWSSNWKPGNEHRGYGTQEEAKQAAINHSQKKPEKQFAIAQHPEGLWYVAHREIGGATAPQSQPPATKQVSLPQPSQPAPQPIARPQQPTEQPNQTKPLPPSAPASQPAAGLIDRGSDPHPLERGYRKQIPHEMKLRYDDLERRASKASGAEWRKLESQQGEFHKRAETNQFDLNKPFDPNAKIHSLEVMHGPLPDHIKEEHDRLQEEYPMGIDRRSVERRKFVLAAMEALHKRLERKDFSSGNPQLQPSQPSEKPKTPSLLDRPQAEAPVQSAGAQPKFQGDARPFNAGMNRGTIGFENELHRDLYDLGARIRNNISANNHFNPLLVKGTDSLEQRIASHPEIERMLKSGAINANELRNLAANTHEHVKAQMKGLKEGEHREVKMAALEGSANRRSQFENKIVPPNQDALDEGDLKRAFESADEESPRIDPRNNPDHSDYDPLSGESGGSRKPAIVDMKPPSGYTPRKFKNVTDAIRSQHIPDELQGEISDKDIHSIGHMAAAMHDLENEPNRRKLSMFADLVGENAADRRMQARITAQDAHKRERERIELMDGLSPSEKAKRLEKAREAYRENEEKLLDEASKASQSAINIKLTSMRRMARADHDVVSAGKNSKMFAGFDAKAESLKQNHPDVFAGMPQSQTAEQRLWELLMEPHPEIIPLRNHEAILRAAVDEFIQHHEAKKALRDLEKEGAQSGASGDKTPFSGVNHAQIHRYAMGAYARYSLTESLLKFCSRAS